VAGDDQGDPVAVEFRDELLNVPADTAEVRRNGGGVQENQGRKGHRAFQRVGGPIIITGARSATENAAARSGRVHDGGSVQV
jgi:hypothetical protein